MLSDGRSKTIAPRNAMKAAPRDPHGALSEPEASRSLHQKREELLVFVESDIHYRPDLVSVRAVHWSFNQIADNILLRQRMGWRGQGPYRADSQQQRECEPYHWESPAHLQKTDVGGRPG